MEEKLLNGGVLEQGPERVQLLLAVMQIYAAQHEEPTLAVGDLNCLLGVAQHHKVMKGRVKPLLIDTSARNALCPL